VAPAHGAAGDFARSLPSTVKPIFLWVPSQNGLFDQAPQRQRNVSVARLTVRPVPETSSSDPWVDGVEKGGEESGAAPGGS
jgi:hypothetical protein